MTDMPFTENTSQVFARQTWRDRLRAFLEREAFQRTIIAVIVANAVIIGLETSPSVMTRFGGLLFFLDSLALGIFVAEILLKLFVYRLTYFKSAWNIFDFTIVAVALVPAGQGLTVLRALRILRALRLLSMVPKMRLVVQGLLGAIPAMASVLALLALVFYVFSVMATKLFGLAFPQWFGTVGASLFSLFQVMTLEAWSSEIVRPVMEVYPLAWAFFVPFILITTFAVLNLFIAIIVNSMQDAAEEKASAAARRPAPLQDMSADKDHQNLLAELSREIRELRSEVRGLRSIVQNSSYYMESRKLSEPNIKGGI
jgi:voltage-gated sodium channel